MSFCRACQLLALLTGGLASAMGLLALAASQSASLEQRKQEVERSEAQEQEGLEAPEQERREAQEQERREAREQERLEAREQERREAQEQERRKAREQERLEAREQERLEAREQERLEAREQERLEAREQERLEAREQERLEAREQERLEAREQELLEAREQERLEAREQELLEAREQERLEAREQERLEAREQERREAQEQERREAQEQELERLQARVQELEHLEARLQGLERLVAERETVIEELTKHLTAREERSPRPAPPKPDPPTRWAGGSAVAAVPAEVARPVPTPSEPASPMPAPPQPPIEGQGETAVASSPPAPGQVEVDVEAAELERALDRTLVQEGVLLLPFGRAEIAPSLEFTRREADVPAVITQDGRSFIGQTRLRRDELTSTLRLRFGLPYDAQLELDLPFRYVDQSEVRSVGFATRNKTSISGAGVGDFGIGVAKTLLRERKWWPDIVGRINWDTATGERRAGDVVLGGNGFNEITGSLSAFKRQDPLAFLAQVSYETAFEKDDERPGDEWAVAIGAVLAASPETSLRFIFEQTFLSEREFEGQEIEGSDARSGVLTLGASSILWRGIFLDVAVGVGVTDDAADYSAIVSLPIRFSLPFLR